jgi:hypothetical protein
MLTQVAALELGARGIRVNAVSPGLVVTPLTAPALEIEGIEQDYIQNTPLGRSGTPEEVAEAVVFCSRAAWLTGEVLDLNGGAHLMRYPDLLGHVGRLRPVTRSRGPQHTVGMSEQRRAFGPFRVDAVEPVRRADGSVDVDATIRMVDRSVPWWLRLLPGARRLRRSRADFLRDAYAGMVQPPTE